MEYLDGSVLTCIIESILNHFFSSFMIFYHIIPKWQHPVLLYDNNRIIFELKRTAQSNCQ